MTACPSVPAAFRPLLGTRVLDVGRWVAAPWCAQVLSWLGAEVYRVEPAGGDPLLDGAPQRQSAARCLYDDANRGKSVRVAESVAEYVQLIRDRLAWADVLVDDHRPAELARLGIDLDEMRQQHPSLVVVSVTGYGLSGPDADRPSCELTAYHAGGEGATLPSENVYRLFPDQPPVRAGSFLADHDTGLTGAVAALAGLVGRLRSGRGDLVEVAAAAVERGLNRTTLSRAWFEGKDFDRSYRGYDYAGALRCTDGWVAVRPVEERHWLAFCQVIGRADLAADPRFAGRGARFEHADALTVELETFTGTRSRDEVRRALLAAGCPGGPFLEPAELAHDPAISSRELLVPVDGGGVAPGRAFHASVTAPGAEFTAGPPRARALPPHGPGALPLAGIRVVDLTWVAAGPYATELLAFLGADVVRVESPTSPDLFRRSMSLPSADLDSSIRFMDLNQGKRSVLANLKTPEGQARVLDLVEHADVLVENYRPGVRHRLGLADDVLHARNPNLVVLALSGFGTVAADADRPGYASVFNAEGGLGVMTGYPTAPPSDVRDTNDLRAGTNGCLAVLAGLFHVLTTGGGVTLDAAARDVLVVLQGHLVLAASRGARPTRAGNTVEFAAPYDCYRCADGRWVAVGVRTDDEWNGLAGVLGPEAADPELRRRASRVERRADVDALVRGYSAGRPAAGVVAELAGAGVPVGLSSVASDLLAEAAASTAISLNTVDHPSLGTLVLVGAPFRLASAGRVQYRRPPLLGEHTADVLAEWLSEQPAAATVGAAEYS